MHVPLFLSSVFYSHTFLGNVQHSSEVWNENGSDEDEDDGIPSDIPDVAVDDSTEDSHCKSLKIWLIVFLLHLKASCYVPDRVICLMYSFLRTFFIVLGRISAPCAVLAKLLPESFTLSQKVVLHALGIRFTKYPVCKKCGTVWNYDDCIEGYGVHKKAKLCSYLSKFKHKRRRCNGQLMKIVELPGRKVFYPLMTYCYVDLRTSLQHLLLNEAFVQNS